MGYATELAMILDELSKQELVSVTHAFKAESQNNTTADLQIQLQRVLHDRFLFNRIAGAAEARSKTAVEQIEFLCHALEIPVDVLPGNSVTHNVGKLIYEKRQNKASSYVDMTMLEVELQKLGVTAEILDIAKSRATKTKKAATYHTVTICE